jgi:putative protease
MAPTPGRTLATAHDPLQCPGRRVTLEQRSFTPEKQETTRSHFAWGRIGDLYRAEIRSTEDVMAEQRIGVVTHYFGNIGVAAIEITEGELRVGDTIHVSGHTSDFTQTVDSMQMENESVPVARVGDEVGLKVVAYAREHDAVHRVTED